jgi:hypothetical protein
MPVHRTEYKIQDFNNSEEMSDIKKEYNEMIEKKEKRVLTGKEFHEISKKLKKINYKLLPKRDTIYHETSPGNTSFDKATRRIEIKTYEIRKDYSRSPSRFSVNLRRTLSRLSGRNHSGGKKHKTKKNRKCN